MLSYCHCSEITKQMINIGDADKFYIIVYHSNPWKFASERFSCTQILLLSLLIFCLIMSRLSCSRIIICSQNGVSIGKHSTVCLMYSTSLILNKPSILLLSRKKNHGLSNYRLATEANMVLINQPPSIL